MQGRVGEDGGTGGGHGVRPKEVRVGPHQHLHRVDAPVLRRQVQRRLRLQVLHGGVSAAHQEELRRLRVAILRRTVQGCLATLVLEVEKHTG